MKKIIAFIVPVCTCIISCSKSGSGGGNNGGGQTGALLKEFTFVVYDSAAGGAVDSITNNYTYDSQQRLISNVGNEFLPGQTMLDSITEVYASGSITETKQIWNGSSLQETVTTTYTLDPAGTQAVSSTQTTNDFSNFSTTTTNAEYAYNSQGYLLQEQIFDVIVGTALLTTQVDCTVTNGNTTSVGITSFLIPGDTATALHTSTDFSFLGSSPSEAMTASTGDPINMIVGIAGNGLNLMHADANFIQSAVTSVSGTVVEIENLAYSFDNQNRVTTVIYTGASGNLIAKAYYFY